MSRIEARLEELGLALPPPLALPSGMALPFPWVHARGDRLIISGHGPQDAGGGLAGPFGKVGAEVSEAEAYDLARKTGLAMLGSIQREIGDLDRITGWVRAFGMVNAAPDFDRMPAVINGFSDLILEVFGAEIGRHARSAVGMAGLPMRIAVEIEAEALLG